MGEDPGKVLNLSVASSIFNFRKHKCDASMKFYPKCLTLVETWRAIRPGVLLVPSGLENFSRGLLPLKGIL
jgi:hypothetical protein